MESQKMTQQNFSQFLGISSAALSSIFNGRTKPTLNTVEAIHEKLPSINMLWLLYGEGEMYLSPEASQTTKEEAVGHNPRAVHLDFDETPVAASKPAGSRSRKMASESGEVMTVMKNPDNTGRHIIEIKVYYDDLTYESFVPKNQ